MKIWLGYGTEHSANLVIIGRFKTAHDAREAKELTDRLTAIIDDGVSAGELLGNTGLNKDGMFSEEQMNFFRESGLGNISKPDMISFLYDHSCYIDGKKIIIKTRDIMPGGFINVFIKKSAKVEIFDADDYPLTK